MESLVVVFLSLSSTEGSPRGALPLNHISNPFILYIETGWLRLASNLPFDGLRLRSIAWDLRLVLGHDCSIENVIAITGLSTV